MSLWTVDKSAVSIDLSNPSQQHQSTFTLRCTFSSLLFWNNIISINNCISRCHYTKVVNIASCRLYAIATRGLSIAHLSIGLGGAQVVVGHCPVSLSVVKLPTDFLSATGMSTYPFDADWSVSYLAYVDEPMDH